MLNLNKNTQSAHHIEKKTHVQNWHILDICIMLHRLTLKVLVTTSDAQWEGIGDVGLARYEPARHYFPHARP